MRKNLVSNVLRASAFATACLALAGPNVLASPIATAPIPAAGSESYSSSVLPVSFSTGISSPTGSTANNSPISFVPISSGSFLGSSAVGLGAFQVATLPTGQEVDYKNTPFTITYNPVSYSNGTSQEQYSSSTLPLTIMGVLNGSITGNTSNVVAKFTSVTDSLGNAPIFASPDGAAISTFSIPNNPLNLVPASAGGTTTVQALVQTTTPSPAGAGGNNVPEPTTLAILATALVGLGLRKQLRKARQVD